MTSRRASCIGWPTIPTRQECSESAGCSRLFPTGLPTRQMLDAVIADRPVYLDASDLHSVWVNTAALAELGITDDTPDPIGGRIVRDDRRRCDGLAVGERRVPHGLAGHERGRRCRARHAAVGGIGRLRLGRHDRSGRHGAGRGRLAALMRADQRGDLRVHCRGPLADHTAPATRPTSCARLLMRPHELPSTAAGRSAMAGIKLIVDGTIDGCTAGMLAPYRQRRTRRADLGPGRPDARRRRGR